MAESFVFDIADSLLGKLASYAYGEVSRAYGVYDDLQNIKSTLIIVRGLLLDAEYKDKKHGLHEWTRQIRNICSDTEDVFDGIEFQHKRKEVVAASNSTQMKDTVYMMRQEWKRDMLLGGRQEVNWLMQLEKRMSI